MISNDEILNIKFKICDGLRYEVSEDGIVTVYEKQDHIIQKFFRKMKFKIPAYKKITFDEYSSEAFIQINGLNTVKDIGKSLEMKYGSRVNPLYERLLMFLNYLYNDCRYIEKIK
ncbi:PqqD family peptide modification chaperone [uncultured Clostridium sp.]|uniref:PqqD family peptide modification chaperone n=1 Tax=uncultured Clostridium sp. TaxID=59620 RepID=UPI0025EE9E40|nr:PqqD family peptide modification chaperone [uncultured Clostridium sp.]